MTPPHQQLIAAYLAGEPVADELLAACRKDPEILRDLADQKTLDRLLSLNANDDGPDVFAAEVRQRLEESTDDSFSIGVRQQVERIKRRRIAWIAPVAVAASLTLAFITFQTLRPKPGIAHLTSSTDAAWESLSIEDGDTLTQGLLTLTHGYSEITMSSGARLILEAPIQLSLQSEWLVNVHHGQLVARVPQEAIGFTVTTPNSEVVDLGTEFGISVDRSGASEVHVLSGEVKARPLKGKSFQHLNKDEGMSFGDNQQVTIIKSDPQRFRRVLPGRSADNPEFLHWSCDRSDELLACDGTGIEGQFYPGRLMSLNGGQGPIFQNGQFGEALYFNGEDAFVKTDFPGIGGSRPRTVAFWAKIPRDFSTHNGYGMLGWGLMEPGAAWQISPNPKKSEGPLGRLRVGAMNAPVIGTTDLRDNRWHHIAVVMYGGDEADLSTHVLLYVDGQLENTSVKSVKRIKTTLEHSDSRALQFGRNIGFSQEQRGITDRFFKGWIDEVFIFDTALDQKKIQRLMESNHWK